MTVAVTKGHRWGHRQALNLGMLCMPQLLPREGTGAAAYGPACLSLLRSCSTLSSFGGVPGPTSCVVSPHSWQPPAGCASSAQQPDRPSSAEQGQPAALHEPAWLDGQHAPSLPSHLLLLPPPAVASVGNHNTKSFRNSMVRKLVSHKC